MPAKKVSIHDLTAYLTLRFQSEGIPLTPLKLQKLLYYLQAWHVVFFEKHPFFEPLPEAWVNGPVYREVFAKLNGQYFKNEPLETKGLKTRELEEHLKSAYEKLDLPEDQQQFLEAVIQKYGFMPAEKLVYLAHAEAPWNEAREGLNPFEKSDRKISLETMFNYYNSRREKA